MTSPRVTRAAVHDQAGHRRLDVVHLDLGAGPRDRMHALVGELAAALGVERGAVEHELDLVALARRRGRRATDQQADDARLADDLVVAGEGGRAAGVQDVAVGGDVGVAELLGPGVGLGPVALLGISRRKPAPSTSRPCSAAISRVRSIGKP